MTISSLSPTEQGAAVGGVPLWTNVLQNPPTHFQVNESAASGTLAIMLHLGTARSDTWDRYRSDVGQNFRIKQLHRTTLESIALVSADHHQVAVSVDVRRKKSCINHRPSSLFLCGNICQWEIEPAGGSNVAQCSTAFQRRHDLSVSVKKQVWF